MDPPGTDDKWNNEQTTERSVLDQAFTSLYDNGSGDDVGKKGKQHSVSRPRFSEDCTIEMDAATTSQISGDAGPTNIRHQQ